MGTWELITTAAALAMDAFAVAICKGLATDKVKIKHMLTVGLWFGGFQALMPLIGYLVGSSFASYIESFDHWIAFGLLAIIGVNMIREALGEDEEQQEDSSCGCTGFKTMLMMAIATSIDALAVGVTFAFLKVNIWKSVLLIGITTFIFSFCGVKIGNIFGSRYSKISEIAGGTILIILGIKILIEHML